jgi:CubicO group peptidase (beta-lactamase class C family)
MSFRITTAVAAAALALAVGPAQAGETAAKAQSAQMQPAHRSVTPEALGFDSTRLKRLDDAMAGVVASGRVPGMSYVLLRHGKVVDEKLIGLSDAAAGAPMRKDTIFRVYSMTKPITGVAMMILFEQGKWRLDDPVTKYLPELKSLKVMTGVDDQGKPVLVPVTRPPTMRELMSHTAGFGYGLADKLPVDRMFREKQVLAAPDMQDMVRRVSEIPLMYQPGTSWYYSVAVDLQGAIVERLSGQKLGAFMAENIFRPLRMSDTAFQTGPERAPRLAKVYQANAQTGKLEVPTALFGNPMPTYVSPPAVESGGGGLVSTLGDYARFAQMLANGGQLDGVRILNPRTVALMETNVVPQSVLVNSNGTTASRFNEAIGFGLDGMVVIDPLKAGSLEGRNTFSWGGAAGTWFWVDPTSDVVFVGMIQRLGGTGGDDLGQLARTLTYQALVRPEK